MSNEELKYIFSESACLIPRQMKRYVRGAMSNEESYAVELHLNSCPFCNEAVEGLFEQREGNATEVVTHLTNDFLKDHFSLHQPKVHLNSIAPAQPQPIAPQVQPRRRKRFHGENIWRPSGLAAALLIGIVVIWFAKQRQQLKTGQAASVTETVALQTEQSAASSDDRVLASADLVEMKDDPAPLQVAAAVSSQPQPVQPAVQQPLPQPAVVQQKDTKPVEPQKLPEAKAKPAAPKREEVVVAQYKAPLIDKHQAEAPPAHETIEKMPPRTSNTPVAASAGAFSDDGDSGVADKHREKEAVANFSADDLYGQGKYSAALDLYKQQMNEGGRGKRNYATLQAARCYLAMGNKQSAIQLLQSIVSGGGTHKRAAKRMLEDLGADKGE
ncbi:tetratricopeptide repeat protein [Polluticoccus soli]|uniref:tetratricopeptide repeat protein n=1 Tax=Polluticoccus soli TaxID=3034150 RepID=UPI0023E14CBE|nr:tetratricopeptide repeat protein [Flavipsychrobacter sp. JY13-12]